MALRLRPTLRPTFSSTCIILPHPHCHRRRWATSFPRLALCVKLRGMGKGGATYYTSSSCRSSPKCLPSPSANFILLAVPQFTNSETSQPSVVYQQTASTLFPSTLIHVLFIIPQIPHR
jgi:hypothetical protein